MSEDPRRTAVPESRIEPLDEAECLALIAPGGIGRIAYHGRFGQTVLPVNYELLDGSPLSFVGSLPPSDHPDLLAVPVRRYKIEFASSEPRQDVAVV